MKSRPVIHGSSIVGYGVARSAGTSRNLGDRRGVLSIFSLSSQIDCNDFLGIFLCSFCLLRTQPRFHPRGLAVIRQPNNCKGRRHTHEFLAFCTDTRTIVHKLDSADMISESTTRQRRDSPSNLHAIIPAEQFSAKNMLTLIDLGGILDFCLSEGDFNGGHVRCSPVLPLPAHVTVSQQLVGTGRPICRKDHNLEGTCVSHGPRRTTLHKR